MIRSLLTTIVALLVASTTVAQPRLSVSPTLISVSGTVGGTIPAQFVQIRRSGGGGPLRWTTTVPTGTWLSVSPRSGQNNSTLTLSFNLTGLGAGDYTSQFFVVSRTQSVLVSTFMSLTGAPPPPPPPPPPPTSAECGQAGGIAKCGPQSTIACPTGAIDVLPGQDLSLIMDANPAGASYCIRMGTYRPTRPIRPKSNSILTCEYGAVIDGTNVVQGYDTTGTAILSGWNAAGSQSGVTIRNCIVMADPAVYKWICIGVTEAVSWHVDHVDISKCWQGVNLSYAQSNAYVGYSYVHDNGKGYGTPEMQQWGVGYGGYMTHNVVYEHNEMTRNLGDSKWSLSSDISFHDNYVHDQDFMIWFDGENIRDQVYGNLCEDMTSMCVMNEISGSLSIHDNVMRRVKLIAVFVSTSQETEIFNNVIEDAWRGLDMYINCATLSAPLETSQMTGFDLANNIVHDNIVLLTANAPAAWSGSDSTYRAVLANLSQVNCTDAQMLPYLTNTKNNTYTRDTYHVPNQNPYWIWGSSWITWSEWQATPQDTGGTIIIP